MALMNNVRIVEESKNGNKVTELKIIQPAIEEKDGKIVIEPNTMEAKLHPMYPAKFISILGRVYNMKNVLTLLNKGTDALQHLGKRLTPDKVRIFLKRKIYKIPRYWEIIGLINLDRILADRSLVKEIINHEPFGRVVIYNKLKQGIINVEVKDDKLMTFNKIMNRQLEMIRTEASEGFDPVECDLEEYKKFKNSVKEKYFNTLLEHSDAPILEGIDDTVTNEQLKECYLQ